jgi:sugar phosphate isomerase/epimerase
MAKQATFEHSRPASARDEEAAEAAERLEDIVEKIRSIAGVICTGAHMSMGANPENAEAPFRVADLAGALEAIDELAEEAISKVVTIKVILHEREGEQ